MDKSQIPDVCIAEWERLGKPENVTISWPTALELFNIAQQAWDRGGYSKGEWPSLEKAVDEIGPFVCEHYESMWKND